MSDPLDGLLALNNNFSGSAGPSLGGSASGLFGGMGGLGGLLSAFGGGMSATAAYTSAKNQQAALQAQAQTEMNNATLAGFQSDDAIARGETAAGVTMMKGAQVKGTQRAGLAANGVDLSGGSAQNVLTSTDYVTAVDASTLRTNAAREAWGYQMQVRNDVNRATADRNASDQISPWLSAGTSLLGSAATVANRWYSSNLRTNGVSY